jgi:ferritin-like metal-binding protein YciE
MPANNIREQLVKYLTAVHSTEENAGDQLRTGADAVEDDQLAGVLRDHLRETEEHERLVRARLEAMDAGPSKLKDAAQKGVAAVGGALAGTAADTTGKVAIQALATEHLEIASYRSLHAVGRHAGDTETAALAEQAAARRLDALIEQAAMVGVPQSAGS